MPLLTCSGIVCKKVGKAGRCRFSVRRYKFSTEFQQTAADFHKRRLQVLTVQILPLSFHKWGFSAPHFVFC